jgi:hypothetical protein
VSSKGYSPLRNQIARTCAIVLLFSASLVVATSSLSFNIGPHYITYAQEESFLEICENLVDDDGDGFADVEDPEGCSPNEGVEVVPDQTTPTQDVITYPDGTTCDPNSQSCPPPEETGASTPPAEDAPGMISCPDGSTGTMCPPAETLAEEAPAEEAPAPDSFSSPGSSASSSPGRNGIPDGGAASDAGGSCAAGLPKVDVRATHIGGILSSTPIWHLFVIYADCAGTEYFYRGGPGGPGGDPTYGTIIGTSGPYTSGTVDWAPGAPSVTVATGTSASGADSCFGSELSRIDGTATAYRPLGPNRNTVAKTLLANCGFTPDKPVLVAPGWGDPGL